MRVWSSGGVKGGESLLRGLQIVTTEFCIVEWCGICLVLAVDGAKQERRRLILHRFDGSSVSVSCNLLAKVRVDQRTNVMVEEIAWILKPSLRSTHAPTEPGPDLTQQP